jgi:methylation protein EvaC
MRGACLICGGETVSVIDLGRMPLANGFLPPEADPRSEFFYNLAVDRCLSCHVAQLAEPVAPEAMFHDGYPYFSMTSRRMAQHFGEFAEAVIRDELQSPNDLVVEIGSNDGIMLRQFVDLGVRCVGVEPSRNVAAAAVAAGVPTLQAFFTADTAEDIRAAHGEARAILAANCICHIPDLSSVFAGARLLLAPDGVMVFEDPYLPDILARNAVDQMYDEHVFYFSLSAVDRVATLNGMELVDAERQAVHGGSMRYTLAHAGRRTPSSRLRQLAAEEGALGLSSEGPFAAFRANVREIKSELLQTLEKIRSERGRVLGFGATAKSATILNFCGIGPELVESIVDTTPAKQHTVSPGMHIPVMPFSRFSQPFPDYALLLAWNHAEEIMDANGAFGGAGGKWIHYVPEVRILQSR